MQKPLPTKALQTSENNFTPKLIHRATNVARLRATPKSRRRGALTATFVAVHPISRLNAKHRSNSTSLGFMSNYPFRFRIHYLHACVPQQSRQSKFY